MTTDEKFGTVKAYIRMINDMRNGRTRPYMNVKTGDYESLKLLRREYFTALKNYNDAPKGKKDTDAVTKAENRTYAMLVRRFVETRDYIHTF